MALTIKNSEVERLAEEVARLTGETKTEAVRRALADRHARLCTRVADSGRDERLRRFLETEVWPRVPAAQMCRMPTKAEREELLGYGAEGV